VRCVYVLFSGDESYVFVVCICSVVCTCSEDLYVREAVYLGSLMHCSDALAHFGDVAVAS
jgi:hypothetical protein